MSHNLTLILTCRREYNRRVKEVVEASWTDAGAPVPPRAAPAAAAAEKQVAADKPAKDKAAKAAAPAK